MEKVDREGLLLLFSSLGIGNVRQCWENLDLEQMEQGGLFEDPQGEREYLGWTLGE